MTSSHELARLKLATQRETVFFFFADVACIEDSKRANKLSRVINVTPPNEQHFRFYWRAILFIR